MDKDKLLLTVFVALESAHAYSAFMPSVYTIRTFALTQDEAQDTHMSNLRAGYVPATGFAICVGWLVSEVLHSYWPLAASAVTAMFMIAAYEYAIRT